MAVSPAPPRAPSIVNFAVCTTQGQHTPLESDHGPIIPNRRLTYIGGQLTTVADHYCARCGLAYVEVTPA